MKNLKYLVLLSLIFICRVSYSQNNNTDKRWRITEEQARKEVEETLKDSTYQNIIGKFIILKDEKQVVKFAELILFKIYEKNEIKSQRPYDIFKIDGYWLLKGTLKKNYKGGTFLIIIDSKTCEIIRLTHYK